MHNYTPHVITGNDKIKQRILLKELSHEMDLAFENTYG